MVPKLQPLETDGVAFFRQISFLLTTIRVTAKGKQTHRRKETCMKAHNDEVAGCITVIISHVSLFIKSSGCWLKWTVTVWQLRHNDSQHRLFQAWSDTHNILRLLYKHQIRITTPFTFNWHDHSMLHAYFWEVTLWTLMWHSLVKYLLNSSGMVEINCGSMASKRQMQTCFTFFISREHVCTCNMRYKSKLLMPLSHVTKLFIHCQCHLNEMK